MKCKINLNSGDWVWWKFVLNNRTYTLSSVGSYRTPQGRHTQISTSSSLIMFPRSHTDLARARLYAQRHLPWSTTHVTGRCGQGGRWPSGAGRGADRPASLPLSGVGGGRTSPVTRLLPHILTQMSRKSPDHLASQPVLSRSSMLAVKYMASDIALCITLPSLYSRSYNFFNWNPSVLPIDLLIQSLIHTDPTNPLYQRNSFLFIFFINISNPSVCTVQTNKHLQQFSLQIPTPATLPNSFRSITVFDT